MNCNSLSVLLSVYEKEVPQFLQVSLESLVSQTLPPNEIVLVKDGPLTPELDRVIDDFSKEKPGLLQIVALSKNVGLGEALRIGLQVCKCDIVARMDSDDICTSDRFEKQIHFLKNNPKIDIVGSNILEFEDDPTCPIRVRKVPEVDLAIKRVMRFRNPFNHMSVCFRRQSIVRAGNYRHMPYFEDYDLWVRMAIAKCQFHNIQENLLLVRTTNDFIGRRHGFHYARLEWTFFRHQFNSGFFSFGEFIFSSLTRFPLRIIPKLILILIYSLFLRKKFK